MVHPEHSPATADNCRRGATLEISQTRQCLVWAVQTSRPEGTAEAVRAFGNRSFSSSLQRVFLNWSLRNVESLVKTQIFDFHFKNVFFSMMLKHWRIT